MTRIWATPDDDPTHLPDVTENEILPSFICYLMWSEVEIEKREKNWNLTLVYSEYINFTKMLYNYIALSGLDSWLALVLVTIWSVSSLSLSLSPSLWASLNLLTSHVSCEPSPVYIYIESTTLPFLDHGHQLHLTNFSWAPLWAKIIISNLCQYGWQ